GHGCEHAAHDDAAGAAAGATTPDEGSPYGLAGARVPEHHWAARAPRWMARESSAPGSVQQNHISVGSTIPLSFPCVARRTTPSHAWLNTNDSVEYPISVLASLAPTLLGPPTLG